MKLRGFSHWMYCIAHIWCWPTPVVQMWSPSRAAVEVTEPLDHRLRLQHSLGLPVLVGVECAPLLELGMPGRAVGQPLRLNRLQVAGELGERELERADDGHGWRIDAEASADLLALVDSAKLPAVVTLMGKGCLPDWHPLNYGASRDARLEVRELGAEQVRPDHCGVGVRFDDRVTGKVSAFAPGAKVIHFDIDAAEVGKIRHAEIPVVGPLRLALSQLTRDVASIPVEYPAERSAWLAQLG